MKKLAIVLFTLVSVGCGFFEGDDHPDRLAVPPPDITETTPDGKVVYDAVGETLEVLDGFEPTEPEKKEVCEVETVIINVDATKVDSEAVTFYYDTLKKERTLDGEDMGYLAYATLKSSDHLHLVSTELYIAAGDPFDFLAWVKLKSEGDMIAWGGPFSDTAWRISLKVDGGIDLADRFTDNGLPIVYELRAQSPEQRTYIAADIELLRFYDCKLQ